MTQKQRNILGFSLTALFFITTPVIIFYAMGYRISRTIFEDGAPAVQITGGLRVRTSLPYEVTVDGQYLNTSPLYRVGLPVGQVNVKLDRDGFVPWEKNLDIVESTVTLVDKPILFPEDPVFQKFGDPLEIIDESFKSPTDSSIVFRIGSDLYFLENADTAAILIATLQPNETLESILWNTSTKGGIITTSISEIESHFLFEIDSNQQTTLAEIDSIFPYSTVREPVDFLNFNGSKLFFEQGGHIRPYNFSLDALEPILVSNVSQAAMHENSIAYVVEVTQELIQYDIRSDESVSLAREYTFDLDKYFTNTEDTFVLTQAGVLQSFEVTTATDVQDSGVDIVEYEISNVPLDDPIEDFYMSVNDQKLLAFTPSKIAMVYLDDFQTYTTRNRGDISILYTSENASIEEARFMLLDAEHVLFIENGSLKVVELDDRNTPQVYDFGVDVSFFDWETQGTNLVIKIIEDGVYSFVKFPFRRLLPLL